jgi:hypothetical protein
MPHPSQFVDYMERTRLFYRAQGFERDYVWAHFDDTPFHAPGKPLQECRVTVVTTGVTYPEVPKPIRKAESIAFNELPEHLDTSELAWDKESTHTKDRQSYFPYEVLMQMTREGTIGSLAPRYHFVPTQYSHRATIDEDAPAIVDACIEDEVDIALLIPL